MELPDDKKEGDNLGAAHVNILTKVAKQFMRQTPGGVEPPVPLRVMYISAVHYEPSDEDDLVSESSYSSSSSLSYSSSSSSSSMESSASTSSSSQTPGARFVERYYEAKPMYYVRNQRTWYVDDDEPAYDLDAGAFPGEFVVGDTCIAYWDVQRNAYVAQPMSVVGNSGSDSCPNQNAIIDVTMFGQPTSGTFIQYWTVKAVTEPITFVYNSTDAQFKTALAGHSMVEESDLVVSGGPFPRATMRVIFQDNLRNRNIVIPIADWNGLSGGFSVGILSSLAQLGHPL